MLVASASAKGTHIFFSKNISVYAIFNDQGFNNMLTNDIVSFEQLGPDYWLGGLVVLLLTYKQKVVGLNPAWVKKVFRLLVLVHLAHI